MAQACRMNAATRRWREQKNVKRVPLKFLRVFFMQTSFHPGSSPEQAFA
jgi:hypothetical protein